MSTPRIRRKASAAGRLLATARALAARRRAAKMLRALPRRKGVKAYRRYPVPKPVALPVIRRAPSPSRRPRR